MRPETRGCVPATTHPANTSTDDKSARVCLWDMFIHAGGAGQLSEAITAAEKTAS